ncbi:MAG TPA: hypothetical protein VMG12_22120, partial [Polyangiaceae bacterium]|nr:hypothetical protein [Polyangiaceae bacterium]
MNEHETFDDWPELQEMREVHWDDRMPSDMRERVLSRAGLPRTTARPLVGLDSQQREHQPRPDDAASASSSSAEPSPWDEPAPATRRLPRRTWLFAAAAGFSA